MASTGAIVGPGLSKSVEHASRRSVAVTSSWAPSFLDIFFAAALIWLFAAGPHGWSSLLSDGDAGWHIRTGEYVLDHHRVPVTDLFSFSKAGQPWFAWEWLSDVLLALCFRADGLKGVVLAAGVVIAAFATLLLRFSVWRGADGLVALVITLLGIGSSTIHFLARPHVFTFLFLTASIWIIEADRRRPGARVWLLIPLTALWTNLHAGFLVLPICLVLLVVGSAIEAWRYSGSWNSAGRYGLLTLGCSAASLCNPYGLALHSHIFSYLQSGFIRNLVQEFQSPTFRSEGMYVLEAMLFLSLIIIGRLLAQGKVVETLWILFFAHSALGSVRHIPLFWIVAGPIVGAEITRLWVQTAAGMRRGSVGRIFYQLGADLTPQLRRLSLWALAPVVVLMAGGPSFKWPADFPELLFPTRMVQAHASLLLSRRVLTTDQWGDYLIFHHTPQLKVFFDGRSDFYGEALGKDYLHLMQCSAEARGLLDRYQFGVILLPPDWPLVEVLKRDAAWKLVADDGQAILFSRRVFSADSTPDLDQARTKQSALQPNENTGVGRSI